MTEEPAIVIPTGREQTRGKSGSGDKGQPPVVAIESISHREKELRRKQRWRRAARSLGGMLRRNAILLLALLALLYFVVNAIAS